MTAVQNKFSKSTWLAAALLALLLVVAYLPALRAGFIWDDDDYVTQNATLRDAHGLARIWAEPGATPQYYPLVHSTFWLEYHLWQLRPFGFHFDNLLLHALAAWLLWRLLVRLQIPAASLAAIIFALHPVGVESVAWVTERKNVLSAVFYFAAALAWWRGKDDATIGHRLQAKSRGDSKLKTKNSTLKTAPLRWYFAALGLFVCALLSKTVTCSLPAALLLVAWWKNGRLTARDVWPTLPFFALGLALGLNTAHMEQHTVGAVGAEWALSFFDRVLIAGRAVWFYAGKIIWPANLAFIYSRWEISTGVWWQWLFPAAAGGVVAALWFARNKIGRGPLVAVLFFAGTLFPALGFVNVYPMRFSFVADHFQYLASVGLIVLAAAGLSRLPARIIFSALPLALAMLTWRQAHIYYDVKTLWRDTLVKNPRCWLAQNNLGMVLAEAGDQAGGVALYQAALKLKPDYAEALNNWSSVLIDQGRVDEAFTNLSRALQVEPNSAAVLINLGAVFLARNQFAEAAEKFQTALALNPRDARALNNLGATFVARQQWAEAEDCYHRALAIEPDDATTRFNLATVALKLGRTDEAAAGLDAAKLAGPNTATFHRELARSLAALGKIPDAIAEYRTVLRLAPDDAQAHYNLGALLGMSGQPAAAMEQFEQSLKLNPANAEAQNNLGVALASQGKFADALPHFAAALALRVDYAEAHNNFAFALRQLGRREEAVPHLRAALKLQPNYSQAQAQLRELGINEP
jgi:tetratricopeptide (TPR) repeat protein